MDFNNTQAIYLQIADYVCDKIQLTIWPEDEKIPSVRELAIMLEVNPNTVMRSYEYLQNQEIIYTKRGMGYFAQLNAAKKILKSRQDQFMNEELPLLLKKMQLLNIPVNDLQNRYQQFIDKNIS
ncbi:GntR family transcriptional regulator [Mucilaginibacter sp. FT3.2]|uniref:GntR family transcriptional regulator n=1 Tax=Mucilaginibacter sp. FT3.2 TaxID=2723090 RepID=UPI0016198F89|nr:GntR family transcriptional regulator [Mucilaginibacter sp. FT3.2]MBB6232511.1 DNA-binding transcriptional regulator YhcF (GntR family) [Mucilaginibacter sp. FT3.2]